MTASDEAKKALDGVTPGSWDVEESPNSPIAIMSNDGWQVCAMSSDCGYQDDAMPANARFIAWAREGVPALLAEIAAKDAALTAINDKAIMNAGEFARFVRDTIAVQVASTQPSPDVAALVEADDIPELPEAYQPRNIPKALTAYRAVQRDLAAIREAALREAADHFAGLAVLRKMWSAAEVENAILALIGEKK